MGAGSKYDKDINVAIVGLFSPGERTKYPSFLDGLGFEIVADDFLYFCVYNDGFLQKYKRIWPFQMEGNITRSLPCCSSASANSQIQPCIPHFYR